MNKLGSEAGVILSLTLMFLFATSILILSLLEQGVLEIKMAGYFRDRMILKPGIFSE